MENSLEKIRQVNTERARQQLESARHHDLLDAHTQTQEMTVRSFQTLVEFMARNISKVEVLNQLREIATPDVLALIPAIESLQASVDAKEVDLTPVTALLQDVLNEAKQIPKELPELKEKEEVDYSERFKSLEDAIKTVTEAVKAQETTVEAPVVNVPETQVNVDAPDLKPLQKGFSDVVSAVKAIVIPEVSLDTTRLEKEQKAQTKLLKEIRDKPTGGGGGGGSSWVAINDEGTPVPIQLDNGAVPITGSITASASTLADFSVNDIEEDTISYFGYTKPDGTWLVKSLTDTSVGYATVSNNGTVTSYTDAWTDRATLNYGRFDEAF